VIKKIRYIGISGLHCHHQVSAGQLGFGLECGSYEGKNVEVVL
jgi:hypothetical protein